MKKDSPVSRRQVASALAGVGLFLVLGVDDRRAKARTAAGEDPEKATRQPQSPSQRPAVLISGGRRVVDQAAYDDGMAPTESPDYKPAETRVDAAAWLEAVATEDVATAVHDELQTLASQHPDESPLGPVLSAVSDDEQVSGPVSLTIKRTEPGGPTLLVDCPTGVDVEALNSLSAAEFTDRVVSAAQSELNTDKLTETIGGELSDEAVRTWIEQAYADLDVQFRQRPVEYDETGVQGLTRRAADTRYRSEGVAMGSAVRSETRGATASAGFRGLRAGHAVLVTTAHTFYDREATPYSTDDLIGTTLYQAHQPHSIGRCQALEHGGRDVVDAAAVAVDTHTYPSRYLADDAASDYGEAPIVGTASWELLETYQAEGRPIYKQGAVTGRVEGRIDELRQFSNGYRELGVDIYSDGGDSGGPYVVESDEGWLLAGIHKGVVAGTGLRIGVFIDSITEALDISVY